MKKWFRLNRTKLIEKLIEDVIEDYYDRSKLKDWTSYFSQLKPKTEDSQNILALANKDLKAMCFYLPHIEEMIIGRIKRIISHELAHIRGAREKGAVSQEVKEKKYRGL